MVEIRCLSNVIDARALIGPCSHVSPCWWLMWYSWHESSTLYKALLYATPTHLPSICPFTRPHVIISALSMHLPPVLWAWIRAPATHFLGARILTTLPLSIPPAAFSALPQHLPSPFSVIILSSQYLFQRGPIWVYTSLLFSSYHCPGR